jgi:quercetin dioxygenase-like cupin family protein
MGARTGCEQSADGHSPSASVLAPRREPPQADCVFERDDINAASNVVAVAKDLAAEAPRGLDAQLEGYAWLPRMLDKARAALAGTAGDYLFGCPVDHTCMARLGIMPELVLDLAARHGDDHAVLDALRARGIPSAAEAWFDAQAVEDELQETGNFLRVRGREALPEADGGRVLAGADVSVVLIDAAPGDDQRWHAHPAEEVVVVHDGTATFFLGSRQARIVRAGEVVLVPAGVRHRWVAAGDNGLRAVAVHGVRDASTQGVAR